MAFILGRHKITPSPIRSLPFLARIGTDRQLPRYKPNHYEQSPTSNALKVLAHYLSQHISFFIIHSFDFVKMTNAGNFMRSSK
jgi:hypothetical protein